MDELFRFTVMRSAESVSADASVPLDTGSSFQQALGEAAKPKVRGGVVASSDAVVAVAGTYLSSETFCSNPSKLKIGPALSAYVIALEKQPSATKDDLENLVSDTFGMPSAKLISNADFLADEMRAKDSLTAAFVSPAGHSLDMTGLANVVRAMAITRNLVSQQASLFEDSGVANALIKPLVIPDVAIPDLGTRVRPAGVTDLLVVRQHINRYEEGEIQAITNVMRGESRRMTIQDQITSQTTSTSESDTTTQVTKESDQTEQFSLQNEVDKAVQSQLAIKAGASVSYHGPSVNASVNASVDYSQTKSDSQKMASTYAREIVSKAATQVTTTVKQQLVQQFTQVTDTLEDHTFDNSKGTEHISAVYQWINKIYTAQIFNYGMRTIYDLIVPEPSLQWLAAFANQQAPGVITPEPPPPFNVDLQNLAADTYEQQAVTYRASGVPAPPLQTQVVAATAIITKDQQATDAAVAIAIPDGYVATQAWVSCQYDWTDPQNGLEVLFGEKVITFKQNANPGLVPLQLDGSGDIPCTLHAYHVSNYSVSILVECQLATEQTQAWKQQVFDKLLAGWQSWNAAYADQISKQQQALDALGDPTLGGNEDENRSTERMELKRCVLQLLLGPFNYQLIDNPDTFPTPRLPGAIVQGEYVRFFEQAFEWEQVSYVFYPYFWGDQARWIKKLKIKTDDPLFDAFLQAGSARIVLSVRPGFEGALDYVLTYGRLWLGGGAPQVTSSLYLPISEEIREQSDAPGDETPYGSSWEINLPTSLIKLRKDDELPTWVLPDPSKWVWQDGPPSG